MAATDKCADCGGPEAWFHRDSKDGLPCGPLICKSCSTRRFWQEKADDLAAGDPAVVIVDGVHYRIGREDAPSLSRGFGGNLFRIRFRNGRRVDTTNLWHQGAIPPEWREKLPDNAELIPPCGGRWVTPERLAQTAGVRLWCGEAEGHAGLCKMGLLAWTEHGPLLERSLADRTYSVYKEAP